MSNAELNGVGRRVRTELADGYAHPIIRRRRPYDLILANILADPLVELAPALRAHLAPGGRAVLSGLLDRQAEAVVAAHRRQGLRLLGHAAAGPLGGAGAGPAEVAVASVLSDRLAQSGRARVKGLQCPGLGLSIET